MKKCFHCGAKADIAQLVCRDCIADILTRRTVMAFHRFLRPGEEVPPQAERRAARSESYWRSMSGGEVGESDFGLWRTPVRHAGEGWRWTDPSEKSDEPVVPIYVRFPQPCETHDWIAVEHTKVCTTCGHVDGSGAAEEQKASPYLDLDFPYLQFDHAMQIAEFDGQMLDATQSHWDDPVLRDLQKRHARLLQVAPGDHVAREMLSAEIADATGSVGQSNVAVTAGLPFPRVVSPGAPVKVEHYVRRKDRALVPVPLSLVGRTVPRNIDPVQWVLHGWLVEITSSARRHVKTAVIDVPAVEEAFAKLEEGEIVQPKEHVTHVSMIVACERAGHHFILPETHEAVGDLIQHDLSPLYCALCSEESRLRRVG